MKKVTRIIWQEQRFLHALIIEKAFCVDWHPGDAITCRVGAARLNAGGEGAVFHLVDVLCVGGRRVCVTWDVADWIAGEEAC